MADAFLRLVVGKLDILIQKEVGLIWGVDEEMQRLSSLLSTIQAVLEDAEEKQVKSKALQNWLRKLKDAAYKVDDILDECATEAALLESYGQDSSLINKVHSSFLSTCLHPHNISFRHKIGSRIRDIRKKLDEIAKERSSFHLIEGGAERRNDVIENRQTGSILTQSKVYGRDEDKERVIECLVEKVASFDGTSVYPIVGLGGLGKTTLAQMIFNDERIMSHFELRIWVCVSEHFSVRGIIKAIIESVTGTTCQDLNLHPLQRDLQEKLREKRYLLVLDDVWNRDQEKWDKLKFVLNCGSRGSSIIVTTPIKTVASIMGTMLQHELFGLTDDDCWSLFKERAFRDIEEHPNLIALGKELVKKCGGVPLAIKSLGGMMSNKREENQWRSVVENELWNFSQDELPIMPALQLSYSNLPSQLKQCFAFCAIFPKDFFIKRELLIQLWMANGFIPFTGKSDPEVDGNDICNELCWRSFLQEPKKDDFGNIEGFKMHDLIHDLAQSVMEDECLNKMVASSANISKITHFAMVDMKMSSRSFLKSLSQVETLRTFLVHRTYYEVVCDFSKFSSLRVLGVRYAQLSKLSSSIGHLRHLRYLDLSYTNIKKLPKSIITLYNLQTLRLENCSHLRKLPEHIRLLKNLRHLYLDYCGRLSQIPPQIGQITCLKTLTQFIVGEKRGCHLHELKNLNLGGSLHIKHLQRVKNPLDAKEANLVGKQNLHQLHLSWEDESNNQSPEDVEKVLEALQPHANLKKICISGYKGVEFPFWMRDNIFNNVVHFELSNCHCSRLPPLALFPSLHTLHLSSMSQVVYIDNNDQTDGTTTGFPSLKSLKIRDLPSLQRFSREDKRELLPCLTFLEIYRCPELTLPHLPSVKELRAFDCTEVTLGSISNLKNLTFLVVSVNDELNYLPHGMLINLSSLKELFIWSFSKLKCLPTELVGLNALESLQISACNELESFLEQGMDGLKSLKYLSLQGCRQLTSLTEGIQHLSSLQNLDLGCLGFMALPDGIKHLTSLQHLSLSFFKLEVLHDVVRYVPALQALSIANNFEQASLPDCIGDLTNLQYLCIDDCKKLSSLPASIQSLTNLQKLKIWSCPKLEKRCEKERGEDWYKIAHIPNVDIIKTSTISSHSRAQFACVGKQLKAISKFM